MIGKVDVIENDLFDISNRIKEIDEGYFIVYSYRRKRFEVHHNGQKGNSLAFVVPYSELDSRTLSHAMRTRRERISDLIAETERENQRKNKAQYDAAAQKAVASAQNLLRG